MGLITVTTLGSCRVWTPVKLLSDANRVHMFQGKAVGFVHYSKEVIQQIKLALGEGQFPSRLRAYMNIPQTWQYPSVPETFQHQFGSTDLVVCEISSVRELRFKAQFLQINRVREILLGKSPDAAAQKWWSDLTRTGVNEPVPLHLSGVEKEVAQGIFVTEQAEDDLIKDIHSIKQLTGKPMLFVSHFSKGHDGVAIPQRKKIIAAMERCLSSGEFFDPTPVTERFGLNRALKDLGHYTDEFYPIIAEEIEDRANRLLGKQLAAGSP